MTPEQLRKLVNDRADSIALGVMCTDLGLSPSWLYRFRRGDFNDIGANRMLKIAQYLQKSSKKAA